MMQVLSMGNVHEVWGTVRSEDVRSGFGPKIASKIRSGVSADNFEGIEHIFAEVKPEVVINCIGLIKQLPGADDPLIALPINAMLPHRLARLCAATNIRLIQLSTDCVFSGTKGNYLESDPSDALDLYGRSKFIGEIRGKNTLTLRTSFVGHELRSANELLEWFLRQKNSTKGFARAKYSGLTTIELSRVVRDIVLPNEALSGLYHVASHPISKYELLKLICKVYHKSIEIVPDESVVIDRTLNADRFKADAGYVAPEWPEMIQTMFHFNNAKYNQ
jgi:dTDP-4-dehydrorhamnose reductase